MPKTTDTNPLPQPEAPNMRTFTLNSKEFYEAVCPPPEPHMWGPGLPSEPRGRNQEVIVERSTERSAAVKKSRRRSS